MTILEELKSIIADLGYKVETGVFSEKAPSDYFVLTPLDDSFPISADNIPLTDLCSVRITFYTQKNYLKIIKKLIRELFKNDFTITSRRFGGFDTGTNYYQYTIDVEKNYEMEEELWQLLD